MKTLPRCVITHYYFFVGGSMVYHHIHIYHLLKNYYRHDISREISVRRGKNPQRKTNTNFFVCFFLYLFLLFFLIIEYFHAIETGECIGCDIVNHMKTICIFNSQRTHDCNIFCSSFVFISICSDGIYFHRGIH